jgi:Tfp pilus assembly protein PilN
MSVRVNLLPQEQTARQAAARQRTGIIAGAAVLVVALGGAYVWASSQVTEAETRLAAAQDVSAGLRLEVEQLADIRELDQRRTETIELLSTTLAGEVSMAGILQDVASVIPSDTQLDALNVDITPVAADAPADATLGAEPGAIGAVNLTGKTLEAHAPGVERFLLELDKVAGFRDLYVNSSALDDPDERVATYSIDAAIGPEALTGRYWTGLPEELR